MTGGRLTMRRFAIVAAAAATAVLWASPARAGIKKADIFHGSAGAYFTVGGDLWTQPENRPPGDVDSVPFGGTAGGWNLGGGLLFEARFIKYIGLEIDLLFDHHDDMYDIEYFVSSIKVGELRYHMRFMDVRLPILFKVVIDAPAMRFSLGLGPEMVWSRSTRMSIEVQDGQITDAQRQTILGLLRVKDQNDVFLCVELGFMFKVKMLSIPLKLRYAYNPGQPEDWDHRVNPTFVPPNDWAVNLPGSQTMDLRIMLGLAYDF